MARKSVDEMIAQFSPEEWKQIIATRMEELGLSFTNIPLSEPIHLFSNSSGQNYIPISSSQSMFCSMRYVSDVPLSRYTFVATQPSSNNLWSDFALVA